MTLLFDLCRRTAHVIAVLGATIFLLFALLTIADALARSFLGTSLDFVRDTGGLVVAVAGACCLPIVVAEQEHIKLQVFDGLSSVAARTAINLFANLVLLVTLVGMAYQFYRFAEKTHKAQEVTWMLGIQTAPFYFVIAAFMVVCVLMEVVVIAEIFLRPPQNEVNQ